MDADELVRKWLYEKFCSYYASRTDTYLNPELKHLANCPEVQLSSLDHSWECDCYSSYTRDDQWQASCKISCTHGFETSFWTNASEYDHGLPDIIKELIETDLEFFTCPIDERESYDS